MGSSKDFFAMLEDDTEEVTETVLKPKREKKKVTKPKAERPQKPERRAYYIPANEVRNASIQVLTRAETLDAIKAKAVREGVSTNEYINLIIADGLKKRPPLKRSGRSLDAKNKRLLIKTTEANAKGLKAYATEAGTSVNDVINQLLTVAVKEGKK